MRVALITLMLLGILTGPAHAGWTQHPSPVLTPTQAWEKQAVFEPTVLYDAKAKLYRMWYSAGWEDCAVGYATSRDGIHWGKYDHNPVLGQGKGGVDIACRNTIIHHQGVYWMFFSDGIGHGGEDLNVATSRDGKTWKVDPRPVLEPNPAWNTGLANSTVWIEGNTWHVLFDGRSFPIWTLGHASGPDPFHLTQDPGPITQLGTIGGLYGGATLRVLNGVYQLWYIGSTVQADLPTDIYYAQSTDLRSWWVNPDPVVTRDRPWQVDQVADPVVVEKRMYFSACDNPNAACVIGVARRSNAS